MLFSNGWFCITTQLFIKISFTPLTAGCHVVTNGKIFRLSLFSLLEILLWQMSFVSNSAMKMFAKATAILVPMAVPVATDGSGGHE